MNSPFQGVNDQSERGTDEFGRKLVQEVKSMPEGTEKDVKSVNFWMLEEVSRELDPASWAEEFQYTGFDPERVRTHLAKSADANKRDLKTDLCQIAVGYLTRGTRLTKMKKKMSRVGQEEMDKLIRVYKIVETANSATTGKVTMAQISAAYPQVTAKMLQVVPPSIHILELPRLVQSTSFPSVLDPSRKDLMVASLIWYDAFDKRINENKAAEKGGWFKYWKLSFASPIVPLLERIKICVTYAREEVSFQVLSATAKGSGVFSGNFNDGDQHLISDLLSSLRTDSDTKMMGFLEQLFGNLGPANQMMSENRIERYHIEDIKQNQTLEIYDLEKH